MLDKLYLINLIMDKIKVYSTNCINYFTIYNHRQSKRVLPNSKIYKLMNCLTTEEEAIFKDIYRNYEDSIKVFSLSTTWDIDRCFIIESKRSYKKVKIISVKVLDYADLQYLIKSDLKTLDSSLDPLLNPEFASFLEERQKKSELLFIEIKELISRLNTDERKLLDCVLYFNVRSPISIEHFIYNFRNNVT